MLMVLNALYEVEAIRHAMALARPGKSGRTDCQPIGKRSIISMSVMVLGRYMIIYNYIPCSGAGEDD